MVQQEKILVPKPDDLSLIHANLHGGKCELTAASSFSFDLHMYPIVNTHTHVYTQPFLYLEYVNKSFLFQKIDLLKLVMILWHFIFLLSLFLSVPKSYKWISISLHKTIKKKKEQLESVSHIFYWYLYLSGEGFLLL